MRKEFEQRWEKWRELQPLTSQLALGGRGWLGILLVRLPRMLGRLALWLVLLGIAGAGLWLALSWNFGLQSRALAERLRQDLGAESVVVADSRWRGKTLSLGAVEGSWAAPNALSTVQIKGLSVRRLPWEIARPRWSMGKVAVEDFDLSLRVADPLAGEAAGVSGARQREWRVEQLEARRVHLHWRAADLTDGDLRGSMLRAQRSPGGEVDASLEQISGRIGWLQDLQAPTLRLHRSVPGVWHAELPQARWRTATLDLRLDAKLERGLELEGEIHWTELPLTALGRCRDFGIDTGTLTGTTGLQVNFLRVDGMRLGGQLEVAAGQPVRWIGHPLARAIALLQPRTEVGNLNFPSGRLDFQGDGQVWTLRNLRFDTGRGLVVGGELGISDPTLFARDALSRLDPRVTTEPTAAAGAAPATEASAGEKAQTPWSGLFQEIQQPLDSVAERNERLRQSIAELDSGDGNRPRPRDKVSMDGLIWIELDVERIDPNLRDGLVSRLGAREVDGRLRLERPILGVERCSDIGLDWAEEIEAVVAESMRRRQADSSRLHLAEPDEPPTGQPAEGSSPPGAPRPGPPARPAE